MQYDYPCSPPSFNTVCPNPCKEHKHCSFDKAPILFKPFDDPDEVPPSAYARYFQLAMCIVGLHPWKTHKDPNGRYTYYKCLRKGCSASKIVDHADGLDLDNLHKLLD